MHRFETLTTDARAKTLEKIVAKMEFQQIFDQTAFPGEELASLRTEPWEVWLRAIKEYAQRRWIRQGELLTFSEIAWKEWYRRLQQGDPTPFEPSQEELWCSAADIPPSSLLLPDLRAMNMRAWSEVFFAAIMGSAKGWREFPSWPAVPALSALGFQVTKDSAFLRAFSRIDGPNRESDLLLAPSLQFVWTGAMAMSITRAFSSSLQSPRHALLIHRSRGTATDVWMPTKKGAMISLSQEQLWESTLVEPHGDQPPLIATLGLDLIVVELPPLHEPESGVPQEKLSKQRAHESGETRGPLTALLPTKLVDLLTKWARPPAVLYLAADSSVPVPPDSPVVYAPSDPDEVLAKAPPPPDSDS
jgi:hypothetical protein